MMRYTEDSSRDRPNVAGVLTELVTCSPLASTLSRPELLPADGLRQSFGTDHDARLFAVNLLASGVVRFGLLRAPSKINEGQKRIETSHTNVADEGFFDWVHKMQAGHRSRQRCPTPG
jgi:hypothetical protein